MRDRRQARRARRRRQPRKAPPRRSRSSAAPPPAGPPRSPARRRWRRCPTPRSTELEEDDLLNIFLDEAREVVHNGLAAVAALAREPDDVGEMTDAAPRVPHAQGQLAHGGLNEFGEAAWSLEQVLNTWLADQRPATPELLAGTRTALQDFAPLGRGHRRGRPHNWQAAPFRAPAEALRTGEPLAPAPARGRRRSAGGRSPSYRRRIGRRSTACADRTAAAPGNAGSSRPGSGFRTLAFEAPAKQPAEPRPTGHVWSGLHAPDKHRRPSRRNARGRNPKRRWFRFDGLPRLRCHARIAARRCADLGEPEDVDFLETVHTSLEPSLRSVPLQRRTESGADRRHGRRDRGDVRGARRSSRRSTRACRGSGVRIDAGTDAESSRTSLSSLRPRPSAEAEPKPSRA